MQAETFFSAADNELIVAAVRRVEEKTAGEIAVMVVDGSDDYPEGRLFAGIVPGALTGLVVTELWWGDSLWIFLPLALLASLLFGWLAGLLPGVKRFFTPGTRMEERVRQRALLAFYEQGLYKTRDASGVLFFISLFEHRVWVLADQGIYTKVSRETLQEYASAVAGGIRDGRAAELLCQEIDRVGAVLASHFPARSDDVNELSDEVRVG